MGIDSGPGKKTLFRIAMIEVRNAGFSGDTILWADCISRAGPFCQDRPASTLKLRDNPASPVTWNRGHVIGMAQYWDEC